MDACTVYQVFKALPKEEQKRLFDMLKKDLYTIPKTSKKPKNILEEEDAINHLLTHVFDKKAK